MLKCICVCARVCVLVYFLSGCDSWRSVAQSEPRLFCKQFLNDGASVVVWITFSITLFGWLISPKFPCCERGMTSPFFGAFSAFPVFIFGYRVVRVFVLLLSEDLVNNRGHSSLQTAYSSLNLFSYDSHVCSHVQVSLGDFGVRIQLEVVQVIVIFSPLV